MSKEKIRELNDRFRKQPLGLGRLIFTQSIISLPDNFAGKAWAAVREFKDFDDANDPWGEHDFIAVEVEGRKVFAKIDCYDTKYEYGSEDPSDPEMTRRVMTIMLAEDY